MECYASDISRSFPISGRYSREQRALYEVVLTAQLAAIDEVLPGRSYTTAHDVAVHVITEGLCALGLLKRRTRRSHCPRQLQAVFPGQNQPLAGLGLCTMSVTIASTASRACLSRAWCLRSNRVSTLLRTTCRYPEAWRGIGIRIEDDVAVTRDGHEVLTNDVPKDPAVVEALLAKR